MCGIDIAYYRDSTKAQNRMASESVLQRNDIEGFRYLTTRALARVKRKSGNSGANPAPMETGRDTQWQFRCRDWPHFDV